MSAKTKARLLWTAKFDYRGGLEVEEHSHQSFYQGLLVLRGVAMARIGGDAVPMSEGLFLWIPAGVSHGWSVEEGGFLETLDMKFLLSKESRKNFPSDPRFGHRKDLLPLFNALLETARAGGETMENRCSMVLEALLAQWHDCLPDGEPVLAQEVSEESASKLVASLRECFRSRPGQKWTSAMIAKTMGYSYRRLSQICLRETGLTPMNLLKEERIRKARELLCFGEVSVKEIAFALGFESVHHFTRVFREITGCPPATWRSREQAKTSTSIEVAPGFQNQNRINVRG